jgi:hypothetical protein
VGFHQSAEASNPVGSAMRHGFRKERAFGQSQQDAGGDFELVTNFVKKDIPSVRTTGDAQRRSGEGSNQRGNFATDGIARDCLHRSREARLGSPLSIDHVPCEYDGMPQRLGWRGRRRENAKARPNTVHPDSGLQKQLELIAGS